MLEQLANSVTFYAFYTALKVGATGLTVTVDVWEVTKAGAATEIVTGGATTEIGDGLYCYLLASGSVDVEGEYIAVFKTTDVTVDQQHIPAIWAISRAGVENLDAASSSLATAAALATAQADLDNPDQYKADVSALALEATVATVDGKADSILAETGEIGAAGAGLTALGDVRLANLDATVSSRAATGGDGDTLETLSDQLDVAQLDLDTPSQYMADVSGLAPVGEYDAELAAIQLDLDTPNQYKADVSALATAAALITVDGKVDTIQTKTNNLPASPAAVGSAMTLADNAVTAAKIAADAIGASELAADAAAEIAAAAWAYATRTLTQTAASIATVVSGSTITIHRGDTLSAPLTAIGSLVGYVSLDFTVKLSKDDDDDASILRIRKNVSGIGDGLMRLNKATATLTNGSIIISSEALGNITIALDESETAKLIPGTYSYDIQMITATGVQTMSEGTCQVTADVNRAIA